MIDQPEEHASVVLAACPRAADGALVGGVFDQRADAVSGEPHRKHRPRERARQADHRRQHGVAAEVMGPLVRHHDRECGRRRGVDQSPGQDDVAPKEPVRERSRVWVNANLDVTAPAELGRRRCLHDPRQRPVASHSDTEQRDHARAVDPGPPRGGCRRDGGRGASCTCLDLGAAEPGHRDSGWLGDDGRRLIRRRSETEWTLVSRRKQQAHEHQRVQDHPRPWPEPSREGPIGDSDGSEDYRGPHQCLE